MEIGVRTSSPGLPRLHYGSSDDFVPRRGCGNADVQTILSHLLPRLNKLPPAQERLFRVAPQVQVLCRCNWQADRARALTVLIVHGLEGSSESQYVIGTANKAFAAGMNVVRMNVRNCGGTYKLGPTLYHSGLSADVGEVVRTLTSEDRLPRLALVGFSMGGNQVLKLAGEWGREAPPELRAVAALCPGIDLSVSADTLHRWRNRLYEWNFLSNLTRSLRRKAACFPGLFETRQRFRSIRDFDNCVTARHFGFADAEDYYRHASAAPVLHCIAVPTLIIHAEDDPFVRLTPETRVRLLGNPCIRLVETEHGGHCGFLAEPDGYDGRWAERQVVNFLAQF
jgi:predicted alpha/beta-fold hydrolase